MGGYRGGNTRLHEEHRSEEIACTLEEAEIFVET